MRTLSTLSLWLLLNMMHPKSHNKYASKDLVTLSMSASSANICGCRKNKACITLSSELENFNIINFKFYTNMFHNISHTWNCSSHFHEGPAYLPPRGCGSSGPA